MYRLLAFRWSEERRRARFVVGDIHQSDKLGNALSENGLDALSNSDRGHAAPLAAVFEANADPAVVDANQRDAATVGRDGRTDLFVENATDPFDKVLGWSAGRRHAVRPYQPQTSHLRN